MKLPLNVITTSMILQCNVINWMGVNHFLLMHALQYNARIIAVICFTTHILLTVWYRYKSMFVQTAKYWQLYSCVCLDITDEPHNVTLRVLIGISATRNYIDCVNEIHYESSGVRSVVCSHKLLGQHVRLLWEGLYTVEICEVEIYTSEYVCVDWVIHMLVESLKLIFLVVKLWYAVQKRQVCYISTFGPYTIFERELPDFERQSQGQLSNIYRFTWTNDRIVQHCVFYV